MQITRNNDFLVAGQTLSFGEGDYDAILLRTNSSGNVVWCRVFGGAKLDEFFSSCELSNNDIAVSGYTYSWHSGTDDADAWLLRLHSDGTLVWSNHYGGSELDISAWYASATTRILLRLEPPEALAGIPKVLPCV